MGQSGAVIHAVFAMLPAAMQVALAGGAPIGRFTVGGRLEGTLPCVWRGSALIQACILVLTAAVVLDRADVTASSLPDVLFWPVVSMNVLTALANGARPSRPERLRWAPVPVVTLICAIVVGAA